MCVWINATSITDNEFERIFGINGNLLAFGNAAILSKYVILRIILDSLGNFHYVRGKSTRKSSLCYCCVFTVYVWWWESSGGCWVRLDAHNCISHIPVKYISRILKWYTNQNSQNKLESRTQVKSQMAEYNSTKVRANGVYLKVPFGKSRAQPWEFDSVVFIYSIHTTR